MAEKKSFFDKVSDWTMVIAEPMANFASIPWVASLQAGMVAIMPIIIIGSLFLVLSVLGQPWIAINGVPTVVLPFLSPYVPQILVAFNLTMNFLGLYAAVAIAMSYAEKINVPQKAAGLLGLVTFLLMTINSTRLTGTVADAAGTAVPFSVGGIPVSSFSASGLFTAIIVGLLSVRLYKAVVDSGVVIKMPEGVPPMIADSFTALIPYAVVFTLAWFIRTVFDFNLVTWMTTLIAPLFTAADNVVVYTLSNTLVALFWGMGIHGDNMVGVITGPFTTMTVAANAEAMASGLALPYVWTQQLTRMHGWTMSVWPIFIYMFTTKLPGKKALATTALPAGIFTIVEPIMFGLPLALNPILFVPFILTWIVGSVTNFLLVQMDIVGRFFANLPWATPPFLLGPAASGDWKWVLVIAANVAIGYVIYYPFWKVYEKVEFAKLENKSE